MAEDRRFHNRFRNKKNDKPVMQKEVKRQSVKTNTLVDPNAPERLQKFMAECGVASRRKCEELILNGKVMVNGEVVKVLGTKVSKKDLVVVDGHPLVKEEKVYYALYKPVGYLTANSDDRDRKTIMDLILPQDLKKQRIYHVGRLDYDTSGLLLLTNDGELANKLLKSDNFVSKTYVARVKGIFNEAAMIKLTRGVVIEGIKTKRAKVEIISTDKKNNSSLVRVTITEGRNRQIRKMFETVGYEVKHLKREEFAGITLEGLVEGSYRPLSIHEIKVLYGIK
jgi:23S rRNA pseudouridine2605 synthase